LKAGASMTNFISRSGVRRSGSWGGLNVDLSGAMSPRMGPVVDRFC
jgi:hypothetical protein